MNSRTKKVLSATTYWTLEIPPKAWASMPAAERAFFVAVGHIANELNTLRKLILISEDTEKPSVIQERAQLSQTMLLVRLFCMKSYAGYEFLRSISSSDYFEEYLLDADGSMREPFDKLMEYFSEPNAIKYVRNKFGAHYDNKIINKAIKLPVNHTGEIYACEQQGNSIYYASEEIIIAAMLRQRSPFDGVGSAMEALLDDVNDIAVLITDVAHGAMIVVSKRYMGDFWKTNTYNAKKIDLPHVSTSSAPYLTDFN